MHPFQSYCLIGSGPSNSAAIHCLLQAVAKLVVSYFHLGLPSHTYIFFNSPQLYKIQKQNIITNNIVAGKRVLKSGIENQ